VTKRAGERRAPVPVDCKVPALTAIFFSKALRERMDRSPTLKRIRWRLEAGIVDVFWRLCAVMPPEKAAAFGEKLVGAVGPRLPKSNDMARNFHLAFPELSEEEREELLRRAWGNTGAVLGEFPHFYRLCFQEFDKHFEIIEKSNLDDYRSGKKNGIFVTAHLGNWEVSGISVLRLGTPLTVVYAHIKNPYLERIVLRRREGLGCTVVSRAAGARPLVRELARGRSLGLVVDARDDDGELVPFFGMEKKSTIFPARLALRAQCDLIPTRVERLGHARFRITLYDPVEPNTALVSDKEQAIHMMTEVHRMFEQWIRERPHQWLCNKRAWAKDIVPPQPQPRPKSPAAPLSGSVQA